MSGAPLEQAEAIGAYYRDRLGGGDELVYAVDPELEAVGAYEVRSLGTTVVLDGAGIVRFRDEATTSADTLRTAVKKASS